MKKQQKFDFPTTEIILPMVTKPKPSENKRCLHNAKALKARKAKLEIDEGEAKFSYFFEKMLNGIAYCKIIFKDDKPVDFIYIKVNNAFEKLTGLKKAHVVGKKVTEAIPGIKQDHPELFEIYGRVAKTGKEEDFELDFKPLKIWIHVLVYSPKKDYFIAVFENITERKKAEEALRSSSERFMTLANSLPEIVFEIDLNGRTTYINQTAYETIGYTKEDFNKGRF